MNSFKVKTKTSLKRCEVCHQADVFNAIKNECSRCNRVLEEKKLEQVFKEEINDLKNSWIVRCVSIGLLMGILLGVLAGIRSIYLKWNELIFSDYLSVAHLIITSLLHYIVPGVVFVTPIGAIIGLIIDTGKVIIHLIKQGIDWLVKLKNNKSSK